MASTSTEAAHGTVQRHYYKYLRGEETSTNSVATIFAWTGALAKRGELDGTPELVDFAKRLERATVKTIDDGRMTGDLARITTLKNPTTLNTRDFILAIREELECRRVGDASQAPDARGGAAPTASPPALV